jgi:serine/threonine protein kinase/Tfp pilus assembly protein PilF
MDRNSNSGAGSQLVSDRDFEYQVGQRIRGRYEIKQVLGGGMGIVFIARDVSSGEMGAVKTFPNSVLESGHRRQDLQFSPVTARFVTEALVWMSLGVHPNIVTAERVERIDGRPFIFLEYVKGGDLSGPIRNGQLPGNVPRALRLAINFCDGMIHAGLQGLDAHRDIKPQNCLLSERDVLKITDFGLAKALDDRERTDEDTLELIQAYVAQGKPQQITQPAIEQIRDKGEMALTHTGQRLGTAPYMAPEQFEDPKRVDVRADIYSFGVMLVEMLTGRWPFRANSWDEFARLHATAPPPRLSGVPESLRDLVGSCLSKEASKRPARFSEIRRALDEAMRSTGDAAIPQPPAADIRPALTEARRASSLAALGRISEAVVAADRAVQLEPEFGFHWGIRGEVLLDAQRPVDAAQSLRTATHRQPDVYRWWFGRGKAARANHDFAKAHQYLEKALALDGQDGMLWAEWADVLVKQGDHQEAFKAFHRSLELDPYSAEIYLKRGDALQGLHRPDEAHVSFLRACEVNPRSVASWQRRGLSALNLAKSQEALECFRRVYDLAGSTPALSLSMGMAYEAAGEFDHAIGGYELAIREDPNFGVAWLRLGVAQFYQGLLSEARNSLHRAVDLDPNSSMAWLVAGHVHTQTGQLQEALIAYRTAERLGDLDARAWSSITLSRLGQHAEAQELAARAIEAQDSGVAQYAMGEALLGLGSPATAMASFRRAQELGFHLAEDAIARCQAKLHFS